MRQQSIVFQDVSHVYHPQSGTPFTALHRISFEVHAGESTAIFGRSGSGKSTLLNLIAGLDRPHRGRINVAGVDIGELSESAMTSWRGRHVGVVFQFFQLLPTLTVRENLLIAMEFVGAIPVRDRNPRVDELLGLVGVDDQADKLPAHLSGGQQQRVAVARALANRPEVVIADEPTGNLDSASAKVVLDQFGVLRDQGATLVIVTHDESIAGRADRVLRLEDGKLISHRENTPELPS
ncbi:MAG: ABC transporter ATP-binding protein [Myxococcota bacterium]